MTSRTSRAQRQRSRRRIAAVNFLSNISLDGTHRDTKLWMFQPESKVDPAKEEIVDEKEIEENIATVVETQPTTSTVPPASKTRPSPERIGSSNSEGNTSALLDTISHANLFGKRRSGRIRTFSVGQTEGPFGRVPGATHKRKLFAERPVEEGTDCYVGVSVTSSQHSLSHGVSTGIHLAGRASRKSSSSVYEFQSTHHDHGLPRGNVREGSKTKFQVIHFRKSNGIMKNVTNKRLVFVAGKQAAPFAICSTLPYSEASYTTGGIEGTSSTASNDLASTSSSSLAHHVVHQVVSKSETLDSSRQRVPSGSKPSQALDSLIKDLLGVDKKEDGQEVSFAPLLVPYRARGKRHLIDMAASLEIGSLNTGVANFDVALTSYNPLRLDDPELRAGKHRTLLTFPSYMTSIIDYVRPSDLKTELNDQFKERFPSIQLTLSKLRSLKRDLHRIATKAQLDLVTLAASHVYFEKIILKGLITKQNRKLCAGNCLILASKFHDIKRPELKHLLEEIEDTFRIQRKELMSWEMFILVALEFSLQLPEHEIHPHYQRLLNEM